MFKDFLCVGDQTVPETLSLPTFYAFITGASVLILQPQAFSVVEQPGSGDHGLGRQANSALLPLTAAGQSQACVTGCGKYVQVPGSPR